MPYQQPDGRWRVDVSLGRDPVTGKARRRTVRGKSEAEVLAQMRKLQVEADEGIVKDPSKLIVKEWCKIWIEQYTRHLAPRTKTLYEADINNYIIAHLMTLHASHLEECGQYGESYHELLRLENAKLPLFYHAQVVLGLMFLELVYLGDETAVQRARQRIEEKAGDKKFNKILAMAHPALMPFNAAKLAFLDNNVMEARKVIKQARKRASKLQNPGTEYSLTIMLDALEKHIERV